MKLEDPMALDRAFFSANPDRAFYVRRALPGEIEGLWQLAGTNAGIAADMLNAEKRGLMMMVVRQVVRLNDPGSPDNTASGLRFKFPFAADATHWLDAGEKEARKLWDRLAKGRTINGMPANKAVRMIERKLKELK